MPHGIGGYQLTGEFSHIAGRGGGPGRYLTSTQVGVPVG